MVEQICKVIPNSQSGAGLEYKGEFVSASRNAGGKAGDLNPLSTAVVSAALQSITTMRQSRTIGPFTSGEIKEKG
ncbi:hypothetical protein ATANTOWER_030477 [Ataeniobius toweri]|uniref:Uncharacterized protein n=1 Tax=Ataeniobius toweri TaxID=208326 RepID=A0ABU7ARM1_9TELE|nr:hypothetical protein [Ataeniobius toweri]